jgi:hypothetical protein
LLVTQHHSPMEAADPMTVSEEGGPASIRIPAGAGKVIFEGDGATMLVPFLCVVATQTESTDDGGSQAPLATLEIGHGATIKTQFDLRQIAAVSVPSTHFSVTIHNRNEAHQPALEAWVYGSHGNPCTCNTLTFDVSSEMDQPNVLVPAFAVAFSYDLTGPGASEYQALLSDSETGETYGLASPGVRYPLTRRTRFVRFMEVPQGITGQLTFFLRM